MDAILFIQLIAILTLNTNGLLQEKELLVETNNGSRIFANVKIYSNLAEIIQPLGKLPLEFSAEDWADIRPDSLTLVGSNVNVTQQTITEKKKSLNNAQVYVRSPTSSSPSSNAQIKFVKATLIDEKRNLVKLLHKDIGDELVFLTVPLDHIVYIEEPPQSKYYVNFAYDTTDAVYVSYLRSNLNWKTSYQLNLFEESKKPVLISMADIRNNGQAKIDIEHAELLGGDINLKARGPEMHQVEVHGGDGGGRGSERHVSLAMAPEPSISQVEEVAGLYVFTINKPFSIDAKTNYLLPMFRPQVTIERYASISTHFYGSVGNSKGNAQRSYRLSSDRFLSSGNCMIRESDRLVGETSLPDLAAKNKHDFSIGEDADIVYKQVVILISTRTYNETINPGKNDKRVRTEKVYDMKIVLRNFKKDRPVNVEYKQQMYGQSVKLGTHNEVFTQDGSTVNAALILPAGDQKFLSYRVEIIT